MKKKSKRKKILSKHMKRMDYTKPKEWFKYTGTRN